jgi:hypothetical protein
MFPSETLYSGELAQVIKHATSIDPENRYQNVQRMKLALRNYKEAEDDNVEVEIYTDFQQDSNGVLKRVLSHLPYPIRELPGFRSGRPLFFCLALMWYILLIALGFFAVSKNPEYTPKQNRFYDVATFLLFFVPTLYLGNYLGIRDRLPWTKTDKKTMEYVRIGIGCAASIFIVVGVVIIAAMILHI